VDIIIWNTFRMAWVMGMRSLPRKDPESRDDGWEDHFSVTIGVALTWTIVHLYNPKINGQTHLPHALSMNPKLEIRNIMECQRGTRITMDEMIAGMCFYLPK
jgi:hypothetical protein